jgi:hypothetical protein
LLFIKRGTTAALLLFLSNQEAKYFSPKDWTRPQISSKDEIGFRALRGARLIFAGMRIFCSKVRHSAADEYPENPRPIIPMNLGLKV